MGDTAMRRRGEWATLAVVGVCLKTSVLAKDRSLSHLQRYRDFLRHT